MKKIVTKQSPFGSTQIHYDGQGNILGKSVANPLGGTTLHYDQKGQLVGSTTTGPFGDKITKLK